MFCFFVFVTLEKGTKGKVEDDEGFNYERSVEAGVFFRHARKTSDPGADDARTGMKATSAAHYNNGGIGHRSEESQRQTHARAHTHSRQRDQSVSSARR